MPSTPSSGMPSAFSDFGKLVVVFLVIIVIVIVASIGTSIWKASVLRRGGLNPVVAREQLEAKLAQSQLLQPPGTYPPGTRPAPATTEQRLAELQQLFDRGTITADELHEARMKIISGD